MHIKILVHFVIYFVSVYYPGLTRLKPVFSQIQRYSLYDQIEDMLFNTDESMYTCKIIMICMVNKLYISFTGIWYENHKELLVMA